MTDNYFNTVLKDLETNKNGRKIKMDFVTLKCYEYWIRMLRMNIGKPSASDCINILPQASSKRVIADITRYFDQENERELKENPSLKLPDSEDDDDLFSDFKYKHKRDSHLYEQRAKAAKQLRNYLQHSGIGNGAEHIICQNIDDEPIFDKKAQKVFYQSLLNELTAQIKANAGCASDSYLKRLKTLQKTFGLTDAELEYVIYVNIFQHHDLCDNLRRSRTNWNCDSREVVTIFSRLFPKLNVGKLFASDSTLKKMDIVDDDLDLTYRISNFLEGRSGSKLEDLYYKEYKGTNVPYRELCRNDKVKLMFEMVKNNPVGSGLNIFFYGVEGTGKTELAKAVAHELNIPLVMIAINTNGDNKKTQSGDSISARMGSILFAAHKYREQKAILLVDEADMILNDCEKGALNIFMEQIKVPVIWISNNTRWIEPSSMRRFDFSIEFERPDAEKRLAIWKSVIAEQHATKLLSEESVKRFADEFMVTAGGITQAISKAKKMSKADGSFDAEKFVREMLCAQSDLMGLSRDFSKRDSESHAPSYILDALNTDVDMGYMQHVLQAYDAKWKQMKESDKPDSLNVLFYGAPGTGKTELAKYFARSLNRKLLIRKASDLLNCYVGETEQNIRRMFREAEEKKAILFLDEADSMIQDRSGASHSWEVTQVNELLTQMENFKGIFIAATNFNKNLDQASRRRFALKVKFNYLKPEGIEKTWQAFFPQVECPAEAREMKMLAPGDFNAVYGTLRFLDPREQTADKILQCLKQEVNCKDDREGRHMGL